MQTSIVLARLIGPVLIVLGLFMVVTPAAYRAVSQDLMTSRALMYTFGLMAFVVGLAIVNFHNVWALGWPVIITLFGWLCLIGGLVRIFAPAAATSSGTSSLAKPEFAMIYGIVTIVLGAILAIAGYFR